MHLKTRVRRATKVVIRATFGLAACWSGCHISAGAPGSGEQCYSEIFSL